MFKIKTRVINNFNQFLKTVKNKASGEIQMTLIKFNTKTQVVYRGKLILITNLHLILCIDI